MDPERASERERPEGYGRTVGKLSRPAIKRELIVDIALSGMSERALAEKYDCAPSSINEFKQRNALEINAVREDAANQFAGIWVADKAKRISAYRDQIDFIADRIEEGLEDDPVAALKVAQAALKNVAEEMGQLTARVAVQGEVGAKVTHELVGVEIEEI